jgi:hypothetical protein
MASIIWTDVTAHAPELATGVASGAQTDILGFVNASIDPAMLDGETGYRTKLARIFLAAHFGTGALAATGSTAAGPVTAESADGLSISYGALTAALNDPGMLGATRYGAWYLGLVNTSAARGGWCSGLG